MFRYTTNVGSRSVRRPDIDMQGIWKISLEEQALSTTTNEIGNKSLRSVFNESYDKI